MIDQNILPDFTNALIVNGIGYCIERIKSKKS